MRVRHPIDRRESRTIVRAPSGGNKLTAILTTTLAVALGACVSAAPEPAGKPTRGEPPVAPIERTAPQTLAREDFASTAPVRLIVRSATPGEIDSETYQSMQRGLGWGAVVGVVSITEALAIPGTMFSGGALLGGVVVTIGVAAIMGAERAVQERIVRAVRESDFENRLAERLRARLNVASDRASADATLEVVILSYGVVEDKPRDSFCVFADLRITLHAGAAEPFLGRVAILPNLRSTDAPVPDCRARETIADNEGAVIRAALADYANALPALMARRIPGLPWTH